MNAEKQKKQTFVIEIVNQQKFTWEGQIHWIQGDKKMQFRSVMEMLHFMDSAIVSGDDPDQQETDTTEA